MNVCDTFMVIHAFHVRKYFTKNKQKYEHFTREKAIGSHHEESLSGHHVMAIHSVDVKIFSVSTQVDADR